MINSFIFCSALVDQLCPDETCLAQPSPAPACQLPPFSRSFLSNPQFPAAFWLQCICFHRTSILLEKRWMQSGGDRRKSKIIASGNANISFEMVHSKHNQKPKQRKQHPQAKKHVKHVDILEFRAQLDVLGLKIIQVTADGNCFFRALADQLEGNEEEHRKYRSMVVQYIIKNREMFEPFIEDEVPFDEYSLSMEKDGTWAGHMELQAASMVTHTNICIHRSMSPRWYVQNFDNQGARMIHLSYHDGEHYNSVRLKEDPGDGPARPILIKADSNLTSASHRAKVAVPPSRRASIVQTETIKMVIAGSGCEDAEKAEQVLQQVDGDVDAAIEFLIAEQQGEETSIERDEVICQTDNGNDRDRDESENSLQDDKLEDSSCKLKESNSVGQNGDSKEDKKVPRNKMCPCGSKKKYKSCCGTVADRNSSKIVIEGKRGKKQAKKVGSQMVAASHGSGMPLPDLGALCI